MGFPSNPPRPVRHALRPAPWIPRRALDFVRFYSQIRGTQNSPPRGNAEGKPMQSFDNKAVMMPASGGLRPPGTCERRQPMLDGSYHVQSASHRPLRVAGGQPPGRPARPGRAWRVGAAPAARGRPSPVRNPEEPADDRRGLHPWRWLPMTASLAATCLVIVIAASTTAALGMAVEYLDSSPTAAPGPRGLAPAARSARPRPLRRRRWHAGGTGTGTSGASWPPSTAPGRRRRTGTTYRPRRGPPRSCPSSGGRRATGGPPRILPFGRKPTPGRRAWRDDPPPDDAA